MGTNKQEVAIYPDDRISTLLTEHEFLLAVEETASLAAANNSSANDRDTAIMFHLGVLCYIQGMILAVENFKREGRLNDPTLSKEERCLTAILCAQTRWEFAEVYCKNMLNLQINPIGLLIVLKRIAMDGSGEDDAAMSSAVDKASHILEQKAKGDLACISAQKDGVDQELEINAEPNDISEFFALLEKIGTFYMDRTKYETDEQRELHDQIISIYRKITE